MIIVIARPHQDLLQGRIKGAMILLVLLCVLVVCTYYLQYLSKHIDKLLSELSNIGQ